MKIGYAVIIACVCLASCVEVSSGLKIFVTDEIHSGDFANDPALLGATSIEKADDFCNKSASKPDDAHYKALLVDGVNRDAVNGVDWILDPNTTYYQQYNDVVVGTTNDAAIFPVSWAALSNPILPDNELRDPEEIETLVWTGAMGNNCALWKDNKISSLGGAGMAAKKDNQAIHGLDKTCNEELAIYCVQQLAAHQQLFVRVETSHLVSIVDEVQYEKKWSVLVTDSRGDAVAGEKVTVRLSSNRYFKGIRVWGGSNWVPTVSAVCANEDVNLNGVLDVGEDINADGMLTPGNRVRVPNAVVTDARGYAEIGVSYAKNLADWLEVSLNVTIAASGGGASDSVNFILPSAARDLDSDVEMPPGSISPFGSSASCADLF